MTAYAEMIASGRSAEDVAVAFGITPLAVRRRLKPANVPPRPFELFRKDEVSLDQLMALAISDDHDAQQRVWFAMPAYERSASKPSRAVARP